MTRDEREYCERTIEELNALASEIAKNVTSRMFLLNSTDSIADIAKEAMKTISMATLKAQTVIQDHAEGTIRVTDKTLLAASTLLTSCHGGLDEVILYIATTKLLSR
jgi:hypothetical protein